MTPSLTPYVYQAKVARWVDGDTVDLDVDLGFKMRTMQRFRLIGIDTPERGQPGYTEARQLAESLMPSDSPVLFESMKSDKYGRWLIYLPKVSDALLSHGLAVPSPSSWH